MKLTTREKAKLYDELRAMSKYEEPVAGTHNGWHTVRIYTRFTNTPQNFTTALKAMVRGKE